MGASNTTSVLKSYANWVKNGGVRLADLPRIGFDELQREVLRFQSRLANAANILEITLSDFDQLVADESASVAPSPLSLYLVVNFLTKLQSEAGELQHEAGIVKAHAITQAEVVKQGLAAKSNLVAATEKQLRNEIVALATAKKNYALARQELEGSKGAWNTFLTVLTATAYNPVQDNLNKAVVAQAQIPQLIANCNRQLAAQKSVIEHLNYSQRVLPRLKTLTASMTSFRNQINGLLTDAMSAHQNVAHAEEKSAALLKLYTKKAKPEMDELKKWLTVLNNI